MSQIWGLSFSRIAGAPHICDQVVSTAKSDRSSTSSTPGRAEPQFVVFVEIVSYW